MQKVAELPNIPQDVLDMIRDGRVDGHWNPDKGTIEFQCAGTVVGAWQGQEPAETQCAPSPTTARRADISRLIAHSLALRPLTPGALLGAVCAVDETLDKELIRSAIREDTVALASGLVDLRSELLPNIRVEWFDREMEKKRVANRIAPLLHRSGAAFDEWQAFLDRDVYLDLHSSGGIMSGMMMATPFATEMDENEEEEDVAAPSSTEARVNASGKRFATGDNDGASSFSSAPPSQKRRVEDAVRDLQDVDWLGGGDLTKPPVVVPDHLVQTLAAAQSLRRERRAAAHDGLGVPTLHIATSADLDASRRISEELLDALVALDNRLRQHEQLCAKVRHILQQQQHCSQSDDATEAPTTSTSSTSAALLASSISDWLHGQLPKRTPLLLLHRDLCSELSQRIREEQVLEYLQDLLANT